MRVGIIGLGIMGGAYARNLLAKGAAVIGVDPAEPARAAAAAAGAEVHAAPGDWVAGCDLIILSLLSPQALMSVCDALAPRLALGQPVLETGTFALADKQAAEAVIKDAGGVLIDAPVSGTGAQAAKADLVMMASGPEAAVTAITPILETFTRTVIYAGPFGDGTKLKFVANHAVAVHNVAAAETLHYADTLGLDRDTVFAMLSGGAGQSRMSDLRMPLMIEGRYSPATASLTMFKKDLSVIGADIAETGAFTPLFSAASSTYDLAFEQLDMAQDTAAVFEVFQTKRHG